MQVVDVLIISLNALSAVLAANMLIGSYKAEKRLKKMKERNEAVYQFRLWVINTRYDLYARLPSYDTMMEDGKPLTLDSYIPELNN